MTHATDMNDFGAQLQRPALRLAVQRVALCAALCAALAFAPAATALAADASALTGATLRQGPVEVSYRDVAQFTEIAFNPGERTDWLDELGRYLATRAARDVPAGARLSITITDVQRAGLVERWRRGNLTGVRIVRDTRPPRIDLNFRLESAQGVTLTQGERQLRDLGSLSRTTMRHEGAALAHEKNLIDDWLAKEFGSTRR